MRLLNFPLGFLGGASGKETACQCSVRDLHASSISGLGRSLGGGHGSSFPYSCLENLMDRGVWWATVHRVARVGHYWSELLLNANASNFFVLILYLGTLQNVLMRPSIFLVMCLGIYMNSILSSASNSNFNTSFPIWISFFFFFFSLSDYCD